MDKKYEGLLENKTWILVPRPKDKKVLSNRWVFKTKVNQEGKLKNSRPGWSYEGIRSEKG
jgi:hypothetical protein